MTIILSIKLLSSFSEKINFNNFNSNSFKNTIFYEQILITQLDFYFFIYIYNLNKNNAIHQY